MRVKRVVLLRRAFLLATALYRLKDNLSCNRTMMGIVAVVIVVMAFQSAAHAATEERAVITITAKDRSIGSPKAPILMVEYASPTCSPCARFNLDLLPLLKAKYIDNGKVHYIFRIFPLNPVDSAAEAMARCLPSSSYMHFIDMLYRNQKEWDPEFGVTDAHAALIAVGQWRE